MEHHLAFAVDVNYSKVLAAALVSIRENGVFGAPLKIHILYTQLKNDILQRYIDIFKDVSYVEVNPIELSLDDFKGFTVNFYFTLAVYFRIKLPDLIPDAERIVYLDCDLIVRKSLKPLFEIDLKGNALAAVENPFFTRHKELQMPAGVAYLNSGVLIFNAKKFRENGISSTIFEFANVHKDNLMYVDQDAINGTLYNSWLELPVTWNFQTIFYIKNNEGEPIKELSTQQYLKDPAIVHFTTKSKPWHFMNDHPFKKEFIRYYKKAGLKLKNEDFSGRNALKKFYNKQIKRKKYIDYTYYF